MKIVHPVGKAEKRTRWSC